MRGRGRLHVGSHSSETKARAGPGRSRIPGAGALPALPTRGARILAVVKLRNRLADARLWRRAIERAADSPGIDLAVDPVGRKGEQALSVYLRLLAAGRRGDDEPPSSPKAPTLEQVDGGPGYYGQFPNPLPSDPSWFPIGVWGTYSMTRANIDLDKRVGLNLYVWIADPPSANLAGIRAAGMHVLHDAEIQAQFSNKGSESVGYVLEDEIDMVQANAAGAAAARTQLTNILAGLPKDGRARYSNYGKGVAYWNSNSDAEQYVNDFQQLVSVDVYWFTDPAEPVRSMRAAECLPTRRAL